MLNLIKIDDVDCSPVIKGRKAIKGRNIGSADESADKPRFGARGHSKTV